MLMTRCSNTPKLCGRPAPNHRITFTKSIPHTSQFAVTLMHTVRRSPCHLLQTGRNDVIFDRPSPSPFRLPFSQRSDGGFVGSPWADDGTCPGRAH